MIAEGQKTIDNRFEVMNIDFMSSTVIWTKSELMKLFERRRRAIHFLIVVHLTGSGGFM
jgi:hypothetical protein